MADVPLQTKITDILSLPTAQLNDTLVLSPDGAGGVEFRAETGGGGSSRINLMGMVGPFDGGPQYMSINATGTDLAVNNRAILVPFQVDANITVANAKLHVATASGNIDIGIYDASLARLGSTGSVACPAAGAASVALTGSVALAAGTLYYGAFVASSTTAKFFGYASSGAFKPGGNYFRRAESALPLPNPITIAGDNDIARMAYIAFSA